VNDPKTPDVFVTQRPVLERMVANNHHGELIRVAADLARGRYLPDDADETYREAHRRAAIAIRDAADGLMRVIRYAKEYT